MSEISDSENEDNAEVPVFIQATEHVRNLIVVKQDDLLTLYGLYKQATEGQCHTTIPGVFSIQGRAKWNAWNNLGKMSIADAKTEYVKKVQQLDPSWKPFETLPKTRSSNWVVHSCPVLPEDHNSKSEHEKNCFDYVKENNISKLKEVLLHSEINKLDEHGMGLVHWATDRNYTDILEFLISAGADVNLCDEEGQTALHYGASCGHTECLNMLLKSGANINIEDIEGKTCLEVCESEDIRAVFSP